MARRGQDEPGVEPGYHRPESAVAPTVHPLHAPRALAPAVALLASVCACLDLTPVDVTGGDLVLDGGLSDSRVQGPCEACAFADDGKIAGCGAEIAECANDEVCNAIMICMRESSCFEAAGGEEANRCAVPCVLGSGISTPSDPSLQLTIAVGVCAAENCSGICFPELDAGALP